MDRHPEPSREHLDNWIELASALSTAVWSLHARNWAHFGVNPDNVLVREDHGRWRDITLINIDLEQGGELKPDDPRLRPRQQQEDLVGLRETLVSALVGRPLESMRDPQESERLRDAVQGEPARRAMNLCRRYLVEHDPVVETSTELLRKLVHDLGALKALLRSGPRADRTSAGRCRGPPRASAARTR